MAINDVAEAGRYQSSQLQQFLSGSFKLRFEAATGLPPRAEAIASLYASARSSVAPSTSPSPSPRPHGRSPGPSSLPGQQPWEGEQEPPAYRMSRTIKTVEGLWREWTVGLRGQPSVASLDSRWGSRWRAGRQRELQWYSLRLEVIKEIRRTVQAQWSSEEAAMWAVDLRQRQMGCLLNMFCKRLRAGRRACTAVAA